MAIYRVEGPDGRIYRIEGPDDASNEEIEAFATQQFGPKEPSGPPKTLEDARERINSDVRGFGLGVIKPVENLASWAMNLPGMEAADKFMSDTLGTTPYGEIVEGRQAGRAENQSKGAQTVGNIVGVLPTAALPGGALAQGGAAGALLSDEDTVGGVAKDAATNAVLSKAADLVLKGTAVVARPYVSKAAAALRDAGVPMTVGQLAQQAGSRGGAGKLVGNTVKGMEDRLAGFPGSGDIINAARERGVDAYNRAVLNRALTAVGKSLPDDVPVGREGIKYVGDTLAQGYDDLLPKLSAQVDDDFVNGIAQAWDDIAVLPKARQEQFKSIMDSVFVNRAPGGRIAGQALKDAESKLTQYITAYSKSTDTDQRLLGKALETVRDEYRGMIARGNPEQAPMLKALNQGWKELTIAEKAASRQGNTTGVFTPKEYAGAARMADSSVRRRATVRGTTPNQQLTDAAADVLPNTIPDSGTAGRLGAGMAIGYGAGALNPATLAGLAAAAAPYSRPGQKLANSLFVGERGKAMRLIAEAAERARRVSPQVLVPLAESD